MSEGDFVLIPAGTLHAMGEGVFALEVGSLGFKTYRFCDWGRGRELHVEQAFDVLDTSIRPEPAHFGAFDPKAPASVHRGVTHRLFTSDVVDVRGEWECPWAIDMPFCPAWAVMLGWSRTTAPSSFPAPSLR